MNSYVFELSDVSIANGDNTLHINNSDSVFGAIPGSMLWIDSYRPRFVQSVDNTARTVTLTANWDGDSVVNKLATIVPLPSHEQQKQAVDSVNSVTDSARNLLDRFLGLEANYNQYLDDKYNGLKTLINGSIPFETVNELTAYGEPISQGHENNDVLAIVWNDTTPEYNGMYGWSGLAWVKSTYDLMADVKTTLAVREAVSELRTDLLSRGIGNGETGDPELLAAFSTQAMERTWLEVAKDTLGPSALAIARIVAPLVNNDEFTQTVAQIVAAEIVEPLAEKVSQSDVDDSVETLKSDILKRGVGQGETKVDEILAAFTTETLERTWLEIKSDTLGPTDLAAKLIIRALLNEKEFTTAIETTNQAIQDRLSFDNDELAMAFAFESLERTWLEIAKHGGPSALAARLITEALDMDDLSDQQIFELSSRLSIGGGTSGGTINVSSPPLPIALATAPQGAGREYPTLIKSEQNPIVTLADQSASSLLWPWIVDARQDGGSGVALFWSTDHGSHAISGTWMATAPHPEGPWEHHGMIFRDDVTGGEQHETPSVMWDEVNSRWLMYYQLKFVPGYTNQLTMVATAPRLRKADGSPETWTVLGVAVTENYLHNAGDGHTGYFNPFRYDGGWFGFGLYGGTNNSRKAFYSSLDNGRTFQVSPHILQNGQHLINHLPGFDAENWLIKHNSGAVLERNGQLWLLAPVGGAASGGAEIPNGPICAFRVQMDGVTMGRGVDVTPALQPWEDQILGVDQLGNAIAWDGKVYLVYRQGGGDGGFGLMEVY